MTARIYIACSDIKSLADFQETMRESLRFPHYYGNNLDAFWDCICEILEPTIIVVTGVQYMSPEVRYVADKYFQLLVERASQSDGLISVTFESLDTS